MMTNQSIPDERSKYPETNKHRHEHTQTRHRPKTDTKQTQDRHKTDTRQTQTRHKTEVTKHITYTTKEYKFQNVVQTLLVLST